MRKCGTAAAMALVTMSAAMPAQACVADAPLDLDDIQYANAVVVGRIANYEMVLDQDWRRDNPDLIRDPATARFLTDYARFDVLIDEVLLGNVGRTISVTWDNSTFAEPESMAPGPFLIALRDPGSEAPPLRGPSATVTANPEPRSLTVLQAPCAEPFMFEIGSDQAAAVRRILAQRLQR
jgi:hypothetical protein